MNLRSTPKLGKPTHGSGLPQMPAPVIPARVKPSAHLSQEVKRLREKQTLALTRFPAREWDLVRDRPMSMLPHDTDPDALRRKFTLGQIFSNTLTMDGVPMFLIFWHVESQSSEMSAACVNGVASLPQGEDRWDLLMDGLDLLARQNACNEIMFHSFRAGVAEEATANGYEAVSVCYRKLLPPTPAHPRATPPRGGKPARKAPAGDMKFSSPKAVGTAKEPDENKSTV
jgi:hypothetical protein